MLILLTRRFDDEYLIMAVVAGLVSLAIIACMRLGVPAEAVVGVEIAGAFLVTYPLNMLPFGGIVILDGAILEILLAQGGTPYEATHAVVPNRAYSLAAAPAMPNTGPMAKDERDNSTQADLTVHETYDDHGNTQYAVYDGNGLGEISASINGLSARARQAWARQQGKSKDEIDQAGQGHPRY